MIPIKDHVNIATCSEGVFRYILCSYIYIFSVFAITLRIDLIHSVHLIPMVCNLGASGGCAKQNNPVTIVYNKYSNTQTSNNKKIFGININFIWYWKPTKTAEKNQQNIKRCLYFNFFYVNHYSFLIYLSRKIKYLIYWLELCFLHK